MHKIILSLLVILLLSSCKERSGPEPETSKFTERLFSGNIHKPNKVRFQEEISPIKNSLIKENTLVKHEPLQTNTHETIVEDIPILEDNLPVIPEPILIEENKPIASSLSIKQTFSGGVRSDGLDIKTIRSSQNDTRTRLVFDSYTSNGKAKRSGEYTFTYNPSKKKINAVVNGYRKFSAILPQKIRTFPSNSILNNIKIKNHIDNTEFEFSINLTKSASVNIFELKSPARIVVDIIPN